MQIEEGLSDMGFDTAGMAASGEEWVNYLIFLYVKPILSQVPLSS